MMIENKLADMITIAKDSIDKGDNTHLNFCNSIFNIRPIQEDDMEILFAWRTSPEVNRYFASPPPKDLQEQREWYDRYRRDPANVFFMISLKTPEDIKIGYCRLIDIKDNGKTAEIGYVMGDTDSARKVFAYKVIVTCLKLFFMYLGCQDIYGSVNVKNKVPRRFLEKYMEAEIVNGPNEYRKENEVLYRIRRSDFNIFEKKLLEQNEEWRDILNVEHIKS